MRKLQGTAEAAPIMHDGSGGGYPPENLFASLLGGPLAAGLSG